MLEAKQGKKCRVQAITHNENNLILNTENGIIKLEVVNQDIIRIVYTLEKEFSKNRGIGLSEESGEIKNLKETKDLKEIPKFKNMQPVSWEYKDDINEIVLETNHIVLRINKMNAAFQFYDKENTLLLKEPEVGGKYLIPYDAFKTVFDNESKIKRITTPDGVKEIIEEARKEYDRVLYHSRLVFEWQENEALYGLGQQEEGSLNLRGTKQYIHQANMKIAMPFFVSTKGYGIFQDTYSPMIFNDNEYGSYIYNESCEELDYYFIRGNDIDEIIKGYRLLTGKATVLPKWAFGFMQSMERYESQKEILETVDTFQAKNIPIDSIVLDWQSWEEGMWGQKTFDASRFPNPKTMIDSLHEKGVHFMISIWPNMTRTSENYKEMAQKEFTFKESEIYDAFDKNARDLYFKQANEGLLSYGVDAWWCDSSEPFTPEWNQKIKPEPDQNYMDFHKTASIYIDEHLTNAYPLMHAKTMFEGQKKVVKDKRVVNLTRSGYSGIQKYSTILWSGDISANWETLKKQIPAGLNLCASGLPYWTFDIGAFFVKQGELWFWNGDYEKGCDDLGYRELYTRFYQMGAFLPIFRSHGTDTRREIWNFGEKGSMFYDSIEAFTHLRYKLMPYIYSMAGHVYLNDFTIHRLLSFDFANDVKVHNISDQFMFGKSLMVCPVTKPMYYDKDSKPLNNIEKTRQVYLPETNGWYDFWTNEFLKAKQIINAPAPIDRIPIFVKAGSIIPEGNPCYNTNECDESQMNIKVYPGENTSFILYQDENDNYNYEDGQYSVIEFAWEDSTQKLVIKQREGEFLTMPKSISFTIEVVGVSKKRIEYLGEQITVEF